MQKPISVLVVDHDDTSVRIITAVLSTEGYRYEIAPTTDVALALVTRRSFDVMFTELCPRGLSGLQLAQGAKKLRPEMAVVFMTSQIEGVAYDEAIEAGAADFIAKPFTEAGVALRLRHVLHQESLRVMSVTDELTGLANRRGFQTMAVKQLQLARRQKKGVYLLYADLDGLKEINDECGHQEGDAALVETANLLKTTFRESDIVARIGGDEFVVVPIGSTGDNIPAIVGRLMAHLAEVNAVRHKSYDLSLSVGVAYFDPEHPCTVDELLAAGDQFMYEEKKRKGR